MAASRYLKGQALFAFSRRKADTLGIDYDGLKLADLIREIQLREGHTPCFRAQKQCSQTRCCWQLSCGCDMIEAE